eukprot:scaffold151486_cov57-Attheya_sp.AAC.1
MTLESTGLPLSLYSMYHHLPTLSIVVQQPGVVSRTMVKLMACLSTGAPILPVPPRPYPSCCMPWTSQEQCLITNEENNCPKQEHHCIGPFFLHHPQQMVGAHCKILWRN